MTIDQSHPLGRILISRGYDVPITALEVGALPMGGAEEPCHKLLSCLPGSRILAFEPDPRLCNELNSKAMPGITYFPVALGRANEERVFYETEHSMCGSLYRPDPRWDYYYNNLAVMREMSTCKVMTQTVDSFMSQNGIQRVDFIKIDVQGAEYDIFQGATSALHNVLCIVSEVEFVPLYQQQPLFGDVAALLQTHGFMFHKFLGLAGRTMKPIVVGNNINFASQHMWSDAVFTRKLLEPHLLSDDDLLKLAVIVDLYRSMDVCYFLLAQFDLRRSTDLAATYLATCTVAGSSQTKS